MSSNYNQNLKDFVVFAGQNTVYSGGASLKSAYEVKNIYYLYVRLFKIKTNGVFLFEISFFVLEIFRFLYYANEESDDVINRSTKR